MREREFIAGIAAQISKKAPFLTKGIGDDAAVFGMEDEQKWVISTDLLVENIHFIRDHQRPFLLGRKSIAVNLSDIAAMGATPAYALVSIAIPDYLDDAWLWEWRDGVLAILDEFTCALIGGDTTKGERLTINVVAIGFADRREIAYRSGAKAGDDIYVTGYLGESAAGLTLLQRGIMQKEHWNVLYEAHLNPTPQVGIARTLCQRGIVTAMQDLSDGIATDLAHVCSASGVSAVLEKQLLPVSKTLQEAADTHNLDPYGCILRGGEDYQLVFTSTSEHRKIIEEISRNNKVMITRVGRIEMGAGVFLLEENGEKREISYRGFEH